MPPYLATPPPPYSISAGEAYLVWNAEQPAAGNGGASASQQLALTRIPGEPGTEFSVDGFFSGAPGVFEIDVQVSADDVDAHYQTILNGMINSVDAVNNTFHFDAPYVASKFVRLLMRSLANAVNVTATISRG